MSGLFGIIETSKNALFVQQSALQILNHNVANASTPGYSRQRVLLGARSILGDMGWPSGDGVEVLGVQRVTDQFMVSRLGRARADLGEQNAMVSGYDTIEMIFGEPVDDMLGETNLGDSISSFLDSWQIANNPENGDGSGDVRSLILESARMLTTRFNDRNTDLVYQGELLENELEAGVTQANQLLAQIASYNSELVGSPLSESARGNIMDARQGALFELSAITGANWNEAENGTVTVQIGTRTLVQGNTATELSIQYDRSRGRTGVASIHVAGESQSMEFPGGSIRGQMEILNERIPHLLDRLDTLASSIIKKTNEIHQQADGASGGGVDIFKGTDAATISLNDVLDNNPELLSTSGTLTDGRSISEAMFDLHFESMSENSEDTFEDYYAMTIGELGAKSATNRQLFDSSERFAQGIQDRLESVSGVSLDEELANMMLVQAAFQASSRVIAVADSLLDSILATV
jgi:flagellar hook-associated protein 1